MKFRENGDRMEIKIRNVDPVIKESKDELKKKIAHFKQKSDERKSKEAQ